MSFDAASPFVNTAYGQTYAYNIFENKGKRFGYFMDRAFDNQMFKGSKLPAPFGHSPIMSRLTIGDLCCMAEGDLDRNGKPKTADSTSWDTLSYILYMGHSVYNPLQRCKRPNRLTILKSIDLTGHTKILYMIRKVKQQTIYSHVLCRRNCI